MGERQNHNYVLELVAQPHLPFVVYWCLFYVNVNIGQSNMFKLVSEKERFLGAYE